MKRPKGFGSVYKRGRVWWIKYRVGDRWIAETSKSTRKGDAEDLLGLRLRQVRGGAPVEIADERTTFEDLRELLEADYLANERKSTSSMLDRMDRLAETFGGQRASTITCDRLTAYVATRREADAKAATIRYELAILKRGFRLALRAGKVARAPEFPTVEVRNARQGFFEHPAFLRVVAHLPEDLRPVAWFGYYTGWRKAEILTLQWRQIDLRAGVVRLETSKNGEGRTFPYRTFPQLDALIRAQRARTAAVERRDGRLVPNVFHRDGAAIQGFRKAWATACREAGVPGMLFHDLRRTAVRNLERAGVARSRATKLTGHRTEAVYRRYAIVSESDLAEGVETLATLHQRLAVNETSEFPAENEGSVDAPPIETQKRVSTRSATGQLQSDAKRAREVS